MASQPDPTSRDQWYPLGAKSAVPLGVSQDRLMGVDLRLTRAGDGAITVEELATGRLLPVHIRYRMVWTSLGAPTRPLFPMPEAEEEDRRIVECGAVMVRASGLRIIENFLDMAHFPFVHTNILGAEPHTEVGHYTVEIRPGDDEVWATDCQFYQPQAAISAKGGITTQYIYRVMTPFATLLYKTCPNAAARMDLICLFVQPLDEDRCRAHPIMFLLDDESTNAQLVHFQQLIFLQDRIILENQRPVLLPLEPRAEIPTRADAASVAYRRWLRDKGVTYGATRAA